MTALEYLAWAVPGWIVVAWWLFVWLPDPPAPPPPRKRTTISIREMGGYPGGTSATGDR